MITHRKIFRGMRLAGVIVTAFLCGNVLSLRAQEQPAPPPPPQAATPADQSGVVIKKETKLVLVDAVVTDKKGNYVRDLAQNEFKVFEDNKEQAISTFSSGAEAATQPNGQRHYLILFFDNSTMAAPDQIQARGAAQKFIEANAGPDRLMAVVDFGGSLRIVQNFTASSLLLRAAVSGIKGSAVDPNAPPSDAAVTVASNAMPTIGMSSLSNAAADFGACCSRCAAWRKTCAASRGAKWSFCSPGVFRSIVKTNRNSPPQLTRATSPTWRSMRWMLAASRPQRLAAAL